MAIPETSAETVTRTQENDRRLEQLALTNLSRLDRAIATLVQERAVIAENIMVFRFARWQIMIAKRKGTT